MQLSTMYWPCLQASLWQPPLAAWWLQGEGDSLKGVIFMLLFFFQSIILTDYLSFSLPLPQINGKCFWLFRNGPWPRTLHLVLVKKNQAVDMWSGIRPYWASGPLRASDLLIKRQYNCQSPLKVNYKVASRSGNILRETQNEIKQRLWVFFIYLMCCNYATQIRNKIPQIGLWSNFPTQYKFASIFCMQTPAIQM